MEIIKPSLFSDKYLFLKSQTELDLLLLDEEVSKIGTLVQEATESAAVANELRDAAKERVSETYARVCSSLRRPSEGGKVPSENMVEKEAMMDPEYKQALVVQGEARLDAGLWGSIVQGLQTKSYALSVTTDLVKTGFLSQNYILEKRKADIRAVAPPSSRVRMNS